MVRLNQRGVSDIVVVAFMFILLVLAAVLIHGYGTGALSAAAERQYELKAQHLHRALERVTVDPYAVPALKAAGEQLVLEEPNVPDNYLRGWLENTSDYLLPEGFGVELTLTHEENSWSLTYLPEGAGSGRGENFIQKGSLAFTLAGGENVVVVATELRMFELA